MLLTDIEIIEKLRIKPGDRVLDVGGSMMQHKEIKIDTLADVIRPEDAPYGPSRLLAKNFVKADITKEKLPFKDKEFDLVLCTHVLEDLPSPFGIMKEMMRVGKRGLIVTPGMGEDMKFGPIDYTDWLTGARRVPGEAHHKWFFIKEGDVLKVIPKNYGILYSGEFQIAGWTGRKEMEFYWKDSFTYKEVPALNIHSLIGEYRKFIRSNSKDIKKGIAHIYLDNPLNIIKAILKLIFKKGAGYKYGMK